MKQLDSVSQKQKKKVLFVLTNVFEKGKSNEKTGFWLSEATHVWKQLINQGYEIDFISPQGGNAPIDPHSFDLKDPINKTFWDNETYKNKIKNTFKPSEINPDDYIAMHFVGGHGTMWDFPNNIEISNIAKIIYENEGFITAVCHGPAGLVNIKLSNGKYLVDGKLLTSFTNEEEAFLKATDIVPFLLEDKLIDRGARFEKTEIWKEKVVVDGRLITGQNPASAKKIGEILTNLINVQNMKAIVVEKFGGVDGLKVKELEIPTITNEELLIKVKAFGLNPVDYKTRQGGGIASKMQEPIVLGWDIAGTVEKVSANSKFKIGDRVFGMINFPGQGNAYAEYVKALPNHLALIPDNISYEMAAATPLAALTAYQTLVKYAKIKKNDKVLIHAGAGGVGHIAIQIAKDIGAYVISTASKRNENFLKSLGVDEFIDYTTSNFQDMISNVDIVLDCVGGDVGLNSLQTLRQGGILISIPSPFNQQLKEYKNNIDTPWILVQSNGDDMDKIGELLQHGKIKVHIQKTYKMSEIKEAHIQLETRKTRGKLIVKI